MTGHLRRGISAAIVLISATAGCTAPPQASTPGDELASAVRQQQEPTPVKAWTANVKYLQFKWRRLVDRMAAHDRPPDMVFMQEVEARHSDRFRAALAGRFDGNYAMRWVEGDNAVVWNSARFDLANSNTSNNAGRNQLRWKSWGDDGCDERDRGQIALRLWDRVDSQVVVAASIRWTHTTAFACMERNLSALDRKIEDRWPRRALTVVAGDFNSVSDRRTRPGQPTKDLIEAGTESDPECWYRTFSAVDPNQLENDRDTENDRDCTNDEFFRARADTYYDSVGVTEKQQGPNAICDEWTHVRKERARRGSACTDRNNDGLRDRARLDYIWVRWENDQGAPIDLTASEADARFGRAGADRSCIDDDCLDTRYSDHRAAFATIE